MEKVELIERSKKYIEASQKVKAAQKVLEEERDALIPAFKQLCRPDEDGNRHLDFETSKISLVPQRTVNYDLLKKALGPDAPLFTERFAIVPLHLVMVEVGKDNAKDAEEQFKTLAQQFGVKAIVSESLDVEAAFAHLDIEKQDAVKEITSYTLRPYPCKEGFADKVRAALGWLWSK